MTAIERINQAAAVAEAAGNCFMSVPLHEWRAIYGYLMAEQEIRDALERQDDWAEVLSK